MKDLKIFTDNIEDTAKQQIDLLLEQDAFCDCKVRIMPDVHAGSGCVIGFTANLGNKVIPNVVGVDIGCGMAYTKLCVKNIDLEDLDAFIRSNIPCGMNARENELDCEINLSELKCYGGLRNKNNYLQKSLGTLGGGNHFIEIDKDDYGILYLIVHSGSRNLGKQVCDIYQNIAINNCSYKDVMLAEKEAEINRLKACGKTNEISKAIMAIEKKYSNKTKLPRELCYLENEYMENYLHDMRICQAWARCNRYNIIKAICDYLCCGFDYMETIHNYISDDNIVRKGAISAKLGEEMLIPMNMRDGCIVAIGKGNEDWNCSAPHGAGRIMSRLEAKRKLSLQEFKETMQNVFTLSVCDQTIDEAPMVYKPMDEIIKNIVDTVNIKKIIKPIYNFKANKQEITFSLGG